MCPLHKVEQRLRDAAALWKAASEKYFSPDEFRVNSQACIQALRSVTWVLQSHKEAIPNFDTWYPVWQDKLRGNPILRWLVEARNRVEKQGDLEARSTLRISLSESWSSELSFDLNLPPFTRPEEVAARIARLTKPCRAAEEALVKVERRWIEAELPDSELLEALSHCYLVLQKLLAEAHLRSAAVSTSEPCEFVREFIMTNRELPQFMLNADAQRVSWVKVRECAKAGLSLRYDTFRVDASDYARVRDSLGGDVVAGLETAAGFKEECLAWFQIGKRMLQRDGYYTATGIVKTTKGVQLFQLVMGDRAEKHMVIRHLAEQVKRLNGEAVILMSEAWIAEVDLTDMNKHAADFSERREALFLNALKNDRTFLGCHAVFHRVGNSIHFEPDVVDTSEFPPILAPFLKIWHLSPAE